MTEFEWDAAKARENLRKHGVNFEFATQAEKGIYYRENDA
jgi:uncharacterized DUF497 family protein